MMEAIYSIPVNCFSKCFKGKYKFAQWVWS